MPSVASILLREQLRLLKPITSRLSIETARLAQDKIGSLGATVLASRVEVRPCPMPGFEAAFIRPREARPVKTPEGAVERPRGAGRGIILHLHGGAYVYGTLDYAVGFGSILAAITKREVFCVAYRLAPEHPFPAALEDALAAYQYLLAQGYAPEHIALAGESAGGGLIYALCLHLKEKNLPLPGRLVGISPWTDLTLRSESCRTKARRDPCLSRQSLRLCAKTYAAGQLTEPLVSPLYGDLTGLPPSLIFVGSEEILLDDAVVLHDRLRQAGCRSTLVVEQGLWHVYVLYGVPEAWRAWRKIAGFLRAVP